MKMGNKTLWHSGSKNQNNNRTKREAGSKKPKTLNDYGNVPESVDEEYKFLERFMSVSMPFINF